MYPWRTYQVFSPSIINKKIKNESVFSKLGIIDNYSPAWGGVSKINIGLFYNLFLGSRDKLVILKNNRDFLSNCQKNTKEFCKYSKF